MPHGSRARSSLAGALALVALARGGGAHAAEAPGTGGAPGTERVESCPEREAVLAALRKLGARDNPDRVATMAVEAGLELSDLGDGFRVVVGGRARDYDDAGRDCERRARLAAVFAALVLVPEGADGAPGEPPGAPVAAPPPPAPPKGPEVIVAPAPAPPRARARWEVSAGPMLAIAPHRESTVASAGLAIEIARRAPRWSVAMALAVPVRAADVSIGSTAIRLDRAPLRLVVGRAGGLGAARVAVEAGAVVSLLRVQRTGPPPTIAEIRVEPGAHLGAELSLPARRVSLYVALSSDWIPRTYPITLDPEGEVERTPALWLSGEAGLRFALH